MQHESFWVNHYAAKVLYTVDGWVERNMDSVPQSFMDTMLSSKNEVSDVDFGGRSPSLQTWSGGKQSCEVGPEIRLMGNDILEGDCHGMTVTSFFM